MNLSTILVQLQQALLQLLGILKKTHPMPEPTPQPEPIVPTPLPPEIPKQPQNAPQTFPPMILKWADAIGHWEGADPKLNNPGNLKVSPLTHSWGAMNGRQASDGGYLAKFATPTRGRDALCQLLILACKDQLQSYHKARTLGAFTKIYAGNPPQGYINGIVSALGVPPDTLIKTFL